MTNQMVQEDWPTIQLNNFKKVSPQDKVEIFNGSSFESRQMFFLDIMSRNDINSLKTLLSHANFNFNQVYREAHADGRFLIEAVEKKQYEMVEALLSHPSMNSYLLNKQKDRQGAGNAFSRPPKPKSSAFCLAVKAEDLRMINIFLSSDACFTQTGSKQWLSDGLSLSIKQNTPYLTYQILAHSACDKYCIKAALSAAIATEQHDLARQLLNHKAFNTHTAFSFDKRDESNISPFTLAVCSGQWEIVSALLNKSPSVEQLNVLEYQDNLLLRLLKDDAPKELINKLVNIDGFKPAWDFKNSYSRETILLLAVKKGYAALVEQGLSDAAKPLAQLKTPHTNALRIAVEENNVAMVKLLLSHPRVNVDLLNNRNVPSSHYLQGAFTLAIENNNEKMIEAFINSRFALTPNTNQNNDWLGEGLACAIQKNNSSLIDKILNLPACDVKVLRRGLFQAISSQSQVSLEKILNHPQASSALFDKESHGIYQYALIQALYKGSTNNLVTLLSSPWLKPEHSKRFLDKALGGSSANQNKLVIDALVNIKHVALEVLNNYARNPQTMSSLDCLALVQAIQEHGMSALWDNIKSDIKARLAEPNGHKLPNESLEVQLISAPYMSVEDLKPLKTKLEESLEAQRMHALFVAVKKALCDYSKFMNPTEKNTMLAQLNAYGVTESLPDIVHLVRNNLNQQAHLFDSQESFQATMDKASTVTFKNYEFLVRPANESFGFFAPELVKSHDNTPQRILTKGF